MAAGSKPGTGGGGTEEKLKTLMRDTFEELLGEHAKRSTRDHETKEQQWLRSTIREELGSLFEEFVRGAADEDKEKGGAKTTKAGNGEGEAEGGLFETIFGARNGKAG